MYILFDYFDLHHQRNAIGGEWVCRRDKNEIEGFLKLINQYDFYGNMNTPQSDCRLMDDFLFHALLPQ